jgi:hypothetical protein
MYRALNITDGDTFYQVTTGLRTVKPCIEMSVYSVDRSFDRYWWNFVWVLFNCNLSSSSISSAFIFLQSQLPQRRKWKLQCVSCTCEYIFVNFNSTDLYITLKSWNKARMLRPGRLTEWDVIPVVVKTFSSYLYHSEAAHPIFYSVGAGDLPIRVRRPGREANIYTYLVPRLRMHGTLLTFLPTPSCCAEWQLYINFIFNKLCFT